MTDDDANEVKVNLKGSEALEYVREMLRQLHVITEANRFPMVSYLIGMAYIESSDVLRHAVKRDPRATREVAERRKKAA